jgi:hypothetical protein
MVPDAIEKLPLGHHDLVPAPPLFDEVRFGEQLFDLRTKVRAEGLVESVDSKRICGTVMREDRGDIGMWLSLVSTLQREVIAVGRDECVRLVRKVNTLIAVA